MINSSKIQAIFACTCLLIILAIIIGVVVLRNYWNNKAKEIVKRKCEEYAKFACEYQKKEKSLDEIVEGDDASVGMFPHMAFVVIFQKNGPSWYKKGFNMCGGSLISEYFVLSAAHCTNNFEDQAAKVKLGSVVSELFDFTGKLFDVKDIFIHPTYTKSSSPLYDILLLKLDRKVEFSSTIRPICLNTEFEAKTCSRVIVTGWGRTESEVKSLELQTIDLHTDGEIKARCDQWFSNVGLESGGSLLCAGSPSSAKTPYFGDSGGPTKIVLKDKCPYVYEQIAVIVSVDNSTVIGTRGQLSFHLKLEPFIYWIASTVWADEF